MRSTPWCELEKNLALARDWYDASIKHESNPDRQVQLRYSLANKLSADWQRFLRAVADGHGLSRTAIKKIRNGGADAIADAYGSPEASPLAGIEDRYAFFPSFNRFRNAVDHGDEPDTPELEELEQWMADFRAIGLLYGRN